LGATIFFVIGAKQGKLPLVGKGSGGVKMRFGAVREEARTYRIAGGFAPVESPFTGAMRQKKKSSREVTESADARS